MNEDEIKKCKDDAAYFVENYLGIRLTPWQKFYLKVFQNERVFRVMGRMSGKRAFYESVIAYEKLVSELKR